VLAVLTVTAARPRAFDAVDAHLLHELARFAGHQLAAAAAFEAAERAGRTDPLTDLGNRRAFDEALSRELAAHARYGRALALCLVDLDRFKLVNDLGGHLEGDRVLVQVGRRLTEVRGADAAFRLGGDEFALLLPETAREAAELVVRRLARQIAEDSLPHDVGASWGVAQAVDLDGRALFARADAELYARKRAGRGAGVEALG
jgi:diguanylate cyclase